MSLGLLAGASTGAHGEALEQATRALEARDAQAALRALEPALATDAPRPEALSLQARAWLLADSPEEAIHALYRLEEVAPAWPQIDFLLGLAHYRAKRWDVAERHLVRASEQERENGRVWLLLGVAQDHLGNARGAEESFERARALDASLDHAATYRLGLLAADDRELGLARRLLRRASEQGEEGPLRRSAGRHLRHLDDRSTRALDAWVSAGLAYDTNANLAGDGDSLSPVFPFSSSRESDARAELDLYLERLALARGPLGLRVGYRSSLGLHRHERSLDTSSHFGWLRASYDPTEVLGLDLGYGLEWGMADFDAFRRVHVFEPALRAFVRHDLLARLFYRREERGFFDDALHGQDRDGAVEWVGLEQTWLAPDPFGLGRNTVRLGAAWRDEDSQGAEFDARGPVFDAELGVALPWSLELSLLGRLERRRFDDPSSFALALGERSDRTIEWRIALARALGQHFWVSTGFRTVRGSSNVPVFDLDRHVVDLRLIYRY